MMAHTSLAEVSGVVFDDLCNSSKHLHGYSFSGFKPRNNKTVIRHCNKLECRRVSDPDTASFIVLMKMRAQAHNLARTLKGRVGCLRKAVGAALTSLSRWCQQCGSSGHSDPSVISAGTYRSIADSDISTAKTQHAGGWEGKVPWKNVHMGDGRHTNKRKKGREGNGGVWCRHYCPREAAERLMGFVLRPVSDPETGSAFEGVDLDQRPGRELQGHLKDGKHRTAVQIKHSKTARHSPPKNK